MPAISRLCPSKTGRVVLELQKRLTVEEGGPDTNGIKYVIAAVVVPFGLVLIAVFICVMRCRSKGKKALLASEAEQEKTENKDTVKISSGIQVKKDEDGTNIEIRLVPKLDSVRKNQVIERLFKSDTDLFEELRNNSYFSNYMDISERRETRLSFLNNEITEKHIYEAEPSIHRSKSQEIVVEQQSTSGLVALTSMKKRAPDYDAKSQRLSMMSSHDEFYSAEALPHQLDENDDEKIDVSDIVPRPPVGPVTQKTSSNVTGINTKNTPLHRKLIDAQRAVVEEFDEKEEDEYNEEHGDEANNDEVAEMIPFPLKKTQPVKAHSLHLIESAQTTQHLMITKSTAPTSISGSSFIGRIMNGDLLRRHLLKDESATDTDFEYVKPPAPAELTVADVSIPRRDSFEEKLARRSNSTSETESAMSEKPLENKRDSFLDREPLVLCKEQNSITPTPQEKQYFGLLVECADDSEDLDFEANDLVRLSINLEASGLDLSYGGSSRGRRYGQEPQLEDLEEVEEPLSPEMIKRREMLAINLFLIPKDKRELIDSEKNRVIDHQLTDTIRDINKFLLENGVYALPVILESRVLLGGLVISNRDENEISINGRNFSRDSLNKHLSNGSDGSDVQFLLNQALPDRMVSPTSGTSSVYDGQGSMNPISPILGLNLPRIQSPSPNINSVLLPKPVAYEIVNSPEIPKRSSKRSTPTVDHLQYQNELTPGIAGLNAPLDVKTYELSNKSSSSRLSTKSKTRSSKALGIKEKISSPSLRLSEEAALTNRTPDQVVRDKFYDSEESYSHALDDSAKKLKKASPSLYSDMV